LRPLNLPTFNFQSLLFLLSPSRASFARNHCLNAALKAHCLFARFTRSNPIKVVSTLIPSPDISAVHSHAFKYGATHPLARTQPNRILPLLNGKNAFNRAGGVTTRLCSHLPRDSRSDDPGHGLTPNSMQFSGCPHVARLLTYCLAAAVRFREAPAPGTIHCRLSSWRSTALSGQCFTAHYRFTTAHRRRWDFQNLSNFE
jgi:hypothetical protein